MHVCSLYDLEVYIACMYVCMYVCTTCMYACMIVCVCMIACRLPVEGFQSLLRHLGTFRQGRLQRQPAVGRVGHPLRRQRAVGIRAQSQLGILDQSIINYDKILSKQ